VPSKEYLERVVKLLRSLMTVGDHIRARGGAGGERGPQGVGSDELIGAARITPRTVREHTDEKLFDLHQVMHVLATAHGKRGKKRQIYSNAHDFVKGEMLRRGHAHESEAHEFVDVSDVHVNQMIPEVVDNEVSFPLPNEHACRIASPGQFSRFRRNNSTNPHTIIGFTADGKSALQSFRYPTGNWDVSRAREHCGKRGGSFEAARDGS